MTDNYRKCKVCVCWLDSEHPLHQTTCDTKQQGREALKKLLCDYITPRRTAVKIVFYLQFRAKDGKMKSKLISETIIYS